MSKKTPTKPVTRFILGPEISKEVLHKGKWHGATTAKFLSKSQIHKIFGKPSKNNPLGKAVRIRIQEMTNE